MSGFWSPETGDFDTYFMTTTDLIDRYVPGGLWMMGSNLNSQLGDSTTASKSSPVQTIARGTNWKQVDAGYTHAAAIKTDGTLWLWGYNFYGQLGDSTATTRTSPVQTIMRGSDWKQVACGDYSTTIIKTDGTLWSCGYNLYGELADNTSTDRSSPVQTIARGNNWKSVSHGSTHVASIKTDGTLWLWGDNFNGQMGNSTSNNSYSSPIQTIASGSNWEVVSCGMAYTAGIKTDGTLWMWGRNDFGQLGDSTTTNKSSPIQTITRGTNWKQVACGYSTAAIKTDGSLWMWGNNQFGQIGDNTTTNRLSPVQTISGGTNWKQVACGNYHTLAIKTNGSLWLWGSNGSGELGDNTNTNRSSPIQSLMANYTWKQATGGYVFSGIILTSDLGN